MMDRALDAVVRRVKNLDRKHDVPTRRLQQGRQGHLYRSPHAAVVPLRRPGDQHDRYLILHEEVEKTLIDQLNLHYLHAHQIASRAEQAAVRAAGIGWKDYDNFMQKNVKHIGDERLTKVPADLDLKPIATSTTTSSCSACWIALPAAKVPRASWPSTSRRRSPATCRI